MTQDMIAASNLTFNLHEANASDQHQRLQFLEAYAQNHAATSVNCCTALESSVHALGVNLTLVQRELTQQRNESRLQADEMSLLKEMVLRLEEENSQLHIAVGRLNTTNTELQEQNNALHSKVDSLDTRLASLESAIAALTTAATFAPPFDCDSDTDLDNICDEDDSCIADALNDQDSDSVCDGCVPTWSEWSTCTSQCDRGRVFVAADGCPQAETPTTEFQLCFDGGCTFEEALVALQFGPSSTTEDIENALQTVCDNLLEIGPEPLGTCSAEVGCDGMSFSSVSIIIESSFVTSVSFTIVHNGEGEGDCSAIPSANEDVDALISSASAASCQEECEDCQDEYEVETTVTVQQNCDRVVDTSITSPLPLDGTAFLDTLSDSPDLDVSEPEITSVTADLVVLSPPLYGNVLSLVESLIDDMDLDVRDVLSDLGPSSTLGTTGVEPKVIQTTTLGSGGVTMDAAVGNDDFSQHAPLVGGIVAGIAVLAILVVVICWLRRRHPRILNLKSAIHRSKTHHDATGSRRHVQMTTLKSHHLGRPTALALAREQRVDGAHGKHRGGSFKQKSFRGQSRDFSKVRNLQVFPLEAEKFVNAVGIGRELCHAPAVLHPTRSVGTTTTVTSVESGIRKGAGTGTGTGTGSTRRKRSRQKQRRSCSSKVQYDSKVNNKVPSVPNKGDNNNNNNNKKDKSNKSNKAPGTSTSTSTNRKREKRQQQRLRRRERVEANFQKRKLASLTPDRTSTAVVPEQQGAI